MDKCWFTTCDGFTIGIVRDSKGGYRIGIGDGMNGDYKYILIVTEATYVDNTHYDDFWQNKFRNDEYVREYAKEKLETFLQRKMDTEPRECIIVRRNYE